MTNTFVKIFCWCSYGDVERMLCSETRWWKYSLAYFKWPLPGKLEWCLLYRVICKVVREFSFFLTGWFKSKQFPAGGTTWKGKNLGPVVRQSQVIHTNIHTCTHTYFIATPNKGFSVTELNKLSWNKNINISKIQSYYLLIHLSDHTLTKF